MVLIAGIAAPYVAVTDALWPPVPPLTLNETVYVFAVQVGLYLPLLLMVYPALHDVAYVQAPVASFTVNLHEPFDTDAQFWHHWAFSVVLPVVVYVYAVLDFG